MFLTFPKSEEMDPYDLAEFRDRMNTSVNPLYEWGWYAGFSDDAIDDYFEGQGVAIYDEYRAFPTLSSQELLDYFLEIGINPAYTVPVAGEYYPPELMQAIVMVAESDEFSPETQEDVWRVLRDIRNHYSIWRETQPFVRAVEDHWASFRASGHDLGLGFGNDGLNKLFSRSSRDVVEDDPSLLTERKFAFYADMLRMSIEELEAQKEAIRAKKTESLRTYLFIGEEIFPEDDRFVAGHEEARRLIDEYLERPEINVLGIKEKWKRVEDLLFDPRSDLRKLIRSDINFITRTISATRHLSGESLVREYARSRCRYDQAHHDLAGVERSLTEMKTRSQHFQNFWGDITVSGEITIIHAQHMIEALGANVAKNQTLLLPAPKLEKDSPD